MIKAKTKVRTVCCKRIRLVKDCQLLKMVFKCKPDRGCSLGYDKYDFNKAKRKLKLIFYKNER